VTDYDTDYSGTNCIRHCDGDSADVHTAHDPKPHRQEHHRDSVRFQKKKRHQSAGAGPQAGNRSISNGTKGELTAFVAQLLKYASKNGMHLVAPGTVKYQGKTARLTALLVAPGGITGIYCLGFGGTISPHSQSSPAEPSRPWKQHINGQDLTFENPLKVCQEQYRIVQGALEEAGITADLKIVTVFTNARANLLSAPSLVFTQKMFLSYLYDNKDLKTAVLTPIRLP